MVRSDNELEMHHIHISDHFFEPVCLHIFKTREGHSIDRILHHGGISSFVENLTPRTILCKQAILSQAVKY